MDIIIWTSINSTIWSRKNDSKFWR